MYRTILLFWIVLSLALSGCAAAVQAQPPAPLQTQSLAQLATATQVVKPTQPAPTHTPAPMPVLPAKDAFAASVLGYQWEGRAGGNKLLPYDPYSGIAVPGYAPILLGEYIYSVFSPDRSNLAVVTFKSSERPSGGQLILIDLDNWMQQEYELDLDGYVGGMAFDPSGRRVAVAHGNYESQVLVFDLDQGAVTVQAPAGMLVSRLKYTADGSALMLYGTVMVDRFTTSERTTGAAQVALLDGRDLSARWTANLEGVKDGIYPKDDTAEDSADLHQPGAALYFFPGLDFAPDGDILYVVHADEDKLTTVDFAGQTISTLEVRPPQSWLERLLALTAGVAHAKVAEGTSRRAAISPDGQVLYVVGQTDTLVENGEDSWSTETSPLGLQVIRVSDAALLDRVETESSDLSISPDGRYLYLRGWAMDQPWTEVMDSATLEIIDRLQGMELRPAFRLDGEPVLLSSVWITSAKTRMAVVDPRSLEPLSEWDSTHFAWLYAP